MSSSAGIVSRNPILSWWYDHVIATVDHVRVVDKVQAELGWSGRYAFMTLMSAGIAVLGLLLSSPAVVIGAMLISPLMGPIIGLGFGLATFDTAQIRQASFALAMGVVLAVLFTALVVMLSPLQNVTPEIAARTRPNLFDLMVALFSALAGAYAMIRGREGTVVGVAIATALMPPLAVVGFGLATLNWTVFGGAVLLFFTNLMTIALLAAVMARLYGFGSNLSPQHTMLQSVVGFVVLVALAIPLGISLYNIAWEARASRQAQDVIQAQFASDARLSQMDVSYGTKPLRISATVLTPQFRPNAERDAKRTLTQLLGKPVEVALEQYRVGTSQAAEAAQIASAQANARQVAADRVAVRTTEQLALVAGVDPSAVLLDRDQQRALVTAKVLPGAGLQAYRTLEQRVANVATGWTVELIPPAADLPDVSFEPPPPKEKSAKAKPASSSGDQSQQAPADTGPVPDAAGKQAIATAIWGARRLNVPIGVSGNKDKVAVVVKALTDGGVHAQAVTGAGGRGGAVRLTWLPPDATPDADATG
ncbi:hypothetical protein GCM10023219_13500 [Stakelama sediminis]|uniref:Putative hydrophobic protein (TIGR00271 family) n=1 Tax=Stakelama sediminis TaxID=463200 RepID=A0A840YWY4_9SPHN|nr:DUF389 domain-containing protein [Stakelama sediminis]MBB5718075.1 putative hydrophobic protein (TIGR00271 family) [Stakelama sediminis]